MQDDEGGGLDTSLFGSSIGSSNGDGDIGIPGFNEDDYLDLSILNEGDDGAVDAAEDDGGQHTQGQARDGGAADDGVLSEQQQTTNEGVLSDTGNGTSVLSAQRISDSPTTKSQKPNDVAHQQHQRGPQQDAQEEDSNSNHSDRRSDSDRSEHTESSASTTHSQSEPSKPLTDSPTTYSSSMKLPNGDSNSQSSTFSAPTGDSSHNSNGASQRNANGFKQSPTSSVLPPLQPNRPPSPSKRSPTRSGTLALIPEEEESQQQQQRDTQQSRAAADGSNKSTNPASSNKTEQSDSSLSNSSQQTPSAHAKDSQDYQKAASQQPFRMAIPPYAIDGSDTASKSLVAASPTFNSAPLKVATPGQHAQAMEVRRHIYALQIPTLLLVNAELVKGCIFLLEQHKNHPEERDFPMEGSYLELVNRLSSNLGYLAHITNTAGVPNNGSLLIPVLEAPGAASEYLKNLYNQLRAYFMMGQKGGFFNNIPAARSENMSPSSSQQQQHQQAQRPPSPSKQQRVFSGPRDDASGFDNRAPSVTGKRDRQQTEQDMQADNQEQQPDAKRERIEPTSLDSGDRMTRNDEASDPAQLTQVGTNQQSSQSGMRQQPNSGSSQQQAKNAQQLQENNAAPPTASTSGAQTKRRKASSDSMRSAAAGGPQTPRMPNQAQQQLTKVTPSAMQRPGSQGGADSSFSGPSSGEQPQLQQPPQQSSTIPPRIQQHMQAVTAANAAHSPNASQQQGSQFHQQQQQPPVRAPSAMSMQSPMSQPHSGNPQYLRHPSAQPGTPMSGSNGPPLQQMQNNGQPQPFLQPRPPGAPGQTPQGYQQYPMQGQPPHYAQGGPQPSQQSNIPESIDMLAQEMMRLQSMMASARQFKLNHELYGKMPAEAQQQLELKLGEQENQFNQMKMVYERHMNEQQQHREREGQTSASLGRRNAMSPQPNQQMPNMQYPQQRQSMQHQQRPAQMPGMPPQQQGQRQASISSLHHPANMSNAGSPAASIHESPALTHASPHGMVRPGTSQSIRQGEGQMMPPPGRPIQPQSAEAGAPAAYLQQQMQQRPPQYGQQADYNNDSSSPARPPSVLSNPANQQPQQQAHFRAPSVNAYHPGAPTSANGSPHTANFPPSSPATASSPYASSPAGGPHMQPPGSSGGFNLMQQRARMSSLQGSQFARPPTPSSSQQQQQPPQPRQGTPQQPVQPLQPQHTGGETYQQGQPGTPQQQQQQNMGPPPMPSQQSPQQQGPQQPGQQQQQGGPFPPMPAPMGTPQQQPPQMQMQMQGMQGQPGPMQIPPQLYQNPQALHAYIAHVQAQAQAQGRPAPQLPPGLQTPGMGMSPPQGMMMGGAGPQQQYQQGQPGPALAGQIGGINAGRPPSIQPGGLPHHLFPTGFNPNNPSHHHALQQYQQELQQQEQMQQLQRLKSQSQQQQSPPPPSLPGVGPGNPAAGGAAPGNMQQIQPGHPQYEAMIRQQQQLRMQQAQAQAQLGQSQGQLPMNMQQQQQRMRMPSVPGQGQPGPGSMPQGSPPPQQMQQGMPQPPRGQGQGQPQGQPQGFNPNMTMQGRQMMAPPQQPGQQQQGQGQGGQQGQFQQQPLQQRPMFPYAGQGGPQGQQQNGQQTMQMPLQVAQQQQQQQQQGGGNNGLPPMPAPLSVQQQQQQQAFAQQQQQQQNQRQPQQQQPNLQAQQQQQGQIGGPQAQPGSAGSFDFDSYINIQ